MMICGARVIPGGGEVDASTADVGLCLQEAKLLQWVKKLQDLDLKADKRNNEKWLYATMAQKWAWPRFRLN